MFKILVVEDDKNLRKLITTYLRKNEYITYEATNGEEALEVIDTNYIDLIISDIMMEKMDGYELTKSLREANYTIPILLVTAKSTIEDGAIRPPLSSIPGLGGVAAESIYNAVQAEHGKFMSIDDFQIKSKAGKSVIEMLTKFGCFEGMSKSNQLSLFG